MPEKEATARIKINRLLEAAGWRFFGDGALPANRGAQATCQQQTAIVVTAFREALTP